MDGEYFFGMSPVLRRAHTEVIVKEPEMANLRPGSNHSSDPPAP